MGSEWGRIDEAGTVFVKTAEGEREIGSWQAGDAEAGLAFYARRYDDLATEVTLLEKRLESGAGDPASTRKLFQTFERTSLESPSPPTWDYLFLETHPTLAQRIAMVEQWQKRNGR